MASGREAWGDTLGFAGFQPSIAPRVMRAGDTILLGLIGAQISGSRSPVLHQSEAAAQGYSGIYRLIDLDALGLESASLPELLRFAKICGFAGVNITYPCKQAIIPHLDELSDHARILGSVNTVAFRNGRSFGHNTDWSGYAQAFRGGLEGVKLDRVVQFGAGGAGSAVAYGLLSLGVARLTLIDQDEARARAIALQFSKVFPTQIIECGSDAHAAVALADGIVNTTPVGMEKFPGTPFPADWLHASHWVSEIVYFPLETELLARARALGCRTLDGAGMNINQAAEAFRVMTGLTADIDRMKFFFEAAGRSA